MQSTLSSNGMQIFLIIPEGHVSRAYLYDRGFKQRTFHAVQRRSFLIDTPPVKAVDPLARISGPLLARESSSFILGEQFRVVTSTVTTSLVDL